MSLEYQLLMVEYKPILRGNKMNAGDLLVLAEMEAKGLVTKEEYRKAKQIYFDQYGKPSGDRGPKP